MEVKVLGPGCPRCKKLYEEVQKALQHAGLEGVSVEKVEGISDIMAHGVMMTPALVIDGEVKSQGKIPETREIVQWLMTAKAKET
jgi:small redox-active disulfide protein 2